jgi:hypothetical protein
MRGPPITVTCECGETRSLRYGDQWTCEKCGRRWNTTQIPEQEYGRLMHDLRRLRLEMIVAAIVVVAVFIPLIVFVSKGFIFFLPILLGMSAILYGPTWKKRVRKLIA